MLSATIFNCCPCHSLLSTLICIFVGKRRGMLTLQTVIYCCCCCQCSPCRDLAKSFFCGDKRCAYVAAKYSLFCPCRSLRHNLLMKHSAGCASPLRYFVIRYWCRTDAAFGRKKRLQLLQPLSFAVLHRQCLRSVIVIPSFHMCCKHVAVAPIRRQWWGKTTENRTDCSSNVLRPLLTVPINIADGHRNEQPDIKDNRITAEGKSYATL